MSENKPATHRSTDTERWALADARLKTSIETYSHRSRRIEIPWGMVGFCLALFLGIAGPAAWAVYRIGQDLKWW